MRDVVVIGGGLSGLAAAHQLEKHSIPYTIIEVKPRFGGSIASVSEKGFVMDGNAFASHKTGDLTLLDELGSGARLFDFDDDLFGFRDGTESLIHALAEGLKGGRLMRMAVSTIGRWRHRFTICMENGLMFDAGALILAVPARFAERMFHSFVPEIAEGLRDYRYDAVYRASLGYDKRGLPANLAAPPDDRFPFLLTTDQPGRVPGGNYQLIQAGVRPTSDTDEESLVQAVIRHYGLPAKPIVQRLHYWHEADSLSCADPGHRANMSAIKDRLPPGVFLIGSDYSLAPPQRRGAAQLADRIRQGQQAAQAATAYRKANRNAKT